MQQKQLRVLFLYNGIFILAGNLLVPLYSLYLQQFQSSVLTISLAWGILLTSSTLFSLVLSRFATRLKTKEYLLLGGYLVRAFAWLGFFFAGNIVTILVLQALLGLGEALGSPAFDALFAERISGRPPIAAYAKWKMVSNFMTGLGTIIGGAIVSTFGFPILFLLMSMLAIISFAGILLSSFWPRQLVLQPVPVPATVR